MLLPLGCALRGPVRELRSAGGAPTGASTARPSCRSCSPWRPPLFLLVRDPRPRAPRRSPPTRSKALGVRGSCSGSGHSTSLIVARRQPATIKARDVRGAYVGRAWNRRRGLLGAHPPLRCPDDRRRTVPHHGDRPAPGLDQRHADRDPRPPRRRRARRAELSGTAALLELARVFAARETQRTIVLVSTSGGSGGDAGAADFAAHVHGPFDAAIVLGDLAGAHLRNPLSFPSRTASAPPRPAAAHGHRRDHSGGRLRPRRSQCDRPARPPRVSLAVGEQGCSTATGCRPCSSRSPANGGPPHGSRERRTPGRLRSCRAERR